MCMTPVPRIIWKYTDGTHLWMQFDSISHAGFIFWNSKRSLICHAQTFNFKGERAESGEFGYSIASHSRAK